jgi:hypothetical protein
MGNNSSQTTEVKIPEWQTQLATGTMAPLARQVGSQTYTPYTGQTAADLSKYTTQAADIYGQTGAVAGYTPADYNALTAQNMSAYTQGVMDPALARMEQERAKQMAQEQAYIAGSGAFGNERRGVFEAESAANYALGRDAMIADLMRQGYNEAQAATMAQIAASQGAGGQAAAGLSSVGGMETALQQTALDRALEDYRYAYEDPARRLGAVQGAVQGNYGTTQTATQKHGLFDYLTAAATAAAGMR